jgi:predicted transcriptional regulator
METQISVKNEVHEYLNQISLKDIMSKNVLTVYEGWSIRRLSQFFIKHQISGAPVIAADDELVGVITQSDIIRFESSDPSEGDVKKMLTKFCGPFGGVPDEAEIRRIQDKANDYCTVNSIMTPKVMSVDINTSLTNTYSTLVNEDVHRLFITENGLLVGVISAMDILKKIV